MDHAPACVRIVYGKGARSLHISVKNHDTHTGTGKFIYKAFALHGKQLLPNVIDREATKVPYSPVDSHSMNSNSAPRSNSL